MIHLRIVVPADGSESGVELLEATASAPRRCDPPASYVKRVLCERRRHLQLLGGG